MNANGWLIYRKKDAMNNQAYIRWFIKEAKKQKLDLQLILRDELEIGIKDNQAYIYYQNKKIRKPDFSIVRTIEPLLNAQLEAMEISVFNSAEISVICNNKSYTHLAMNRLAIPMVDTIFLQSSIITPPLDYPFVVKEVTGRGGKQVHLISNIQDWNSHRVLLQSNQWIAQPTNVQLGKDIRVFVVGREIVGAVLRKSSTADFRANYKLGGTATWYELTQTERSMIDKIIQHYNFGMVGIDFLIDLEGNLLLNEIEDVVGSRTLSAVSNINILQKYISHIKAEISK